MGEVLEVVTLGGLRLRVAGRPLTPPDARSAEALLVYLALQERMVPRDVLAHLLWPERDEERARANLRSAVYRLRRLLPDHVRADRRAIGLGGEIEVDALELERRLLAGDVAGAATLYRGTFLAGLHLGDSPEFEAWAAAEAERFATLALAAHQGAVERALADGAAEEALRLARTLLILEPLHEPTHRVVMRLLGEAGRVPEALAHVDAFRRRLADEIGLEPDAATTRLAASLRRREPAEDGVSTSTLVPPAPPSEAAAFARSTLDDALPAYAGAFVGREAELATLLRRLGDPDCRWLTVTGPGGVGKTRLAVEAIRRRGVHGVERTVYVPLAGVGAPHLLLPALAEAVGVPLVPMRDLDVQTLAYLRDKRLLLVLDNLEHLVGGVGALADLLRRTPGVRVLATSRVRLHLPEEWLLLLGGLPTGGGAEEIFLDSAARGDGGVDRLRDAGSIARICDLVGGLPLAIELAAAWAPALAPAAIAAALEVDLSLLRAPRPDLPERHRTIEGVLASSWTQLPTPLAAVFARLAPFRGGFTSADAARVAGATLPDLLALVDRSLLHSSRDGRFELHELLRRSALARLGDLKALETTQRAHAEAFAVTAERARDDVLGSRVLTGLANFQLERDNLRAALDGSLAAGATGLATRLVDAMSLGWRLTSAFTEASDWIERARSLPGLSRRDRALLAHHAGHFAWMSGDFEEADALLRDALAGWDADERLERAVTRVSLAMTSFALRDLERGLASLRDALHDLAEAEGTGAGWWRAVAYGWRGKLLVAQGDVAGAGEALDTALRLFTELDNLWGLGMFVGVAAELRFRQGDLDAARRLAERSVVLLERVGFLHALAPTCTLLGAIARAAGDPPANERWVARAVALYRELGDEASAQEAEAARAGAVAASGASPTGASSAPPSPDEAP
jgi:DNA-binding SARP family transcriptional activator/predicted ATPase